MPQHAETETGECRGCLATQAWPSKPRPCDAWMDHAAILFQLEVGQAQRTFCSVTSVCTQMWFSTRPFSRTGVTLVCIQNCSPPGR